MSRCDGSSMRDGLSRPPGRARKPVAQNARNFTQGHAWPIERFRSRLGWEVPSREVTNSERENCRIAGVVRQHIFFTTRAGFPSARA